MGCEEKVLYSQKLRKVMENADLSEKLTGMDQALWYFECPYIKLH